MILDPADTQSRAFDVIQNAREIGMQFALDLRREAWGAVLRAEHKVREDAGQGLRHAGRVSLSDRKERKEAAGVGGDAPGYRSPSGRDEGGVVAFRLTQPGGLG